MCASLVAVTGVVRLPGQLQKQTKVGPERLHVAGALAIPGEGNDMDDATWQRSGLEFGGAAHRRGRRKTASTSRMVAMRALGSVVYAARLADGTIKFGWTEHFDHRLRWLCSYMRQDVELLAFKLGGYEDEQAIHAALRQHLLEGRREYYHPSPEVLAIVNEMRIALNMSPLAA